MYQPIKLVHPSPKPEVIMINQEIVVLALDFTYQKSTASCAAKLDEER